MNKEQEYLKNKLKKGSKGVYYDTWKHRYCRTYKGGRWTYLKKISSKKLRHSSSDKPSKKEFDINWIYF